MLALASLYAVVLPFIAALSAAPAPPRVVAIGGATVIVGEDWSEATSDGASTSLTQGGATLVIGEPRPATGSVVTSLDDLTAEWIADAPEGSIATAPRTFETEAGDSAATVVLQEPLQTVQAWVVSDGQSEVIAVLTAPATAWDRVSSAAQTLILSLRLPEATP